MEQYAIDLFDGHCDAVFLRYLSGGGLRRNDGHVDLERMGKYRRCAQFFALFGEPEPTPVRDLSGKTHRELFLEEYALFEREMAANADLAAFCRTGAEAEAAFRSGRRASQRRSARRRGWTYGNRGSPGRRRRPRTGRCRPYRSR